MSFIRFNAKRHCDPVTLEAVVREDLDPKALQKATHHLASCSACQRRLTEISAQENFWSELPEMLADTASEYPAMDEEYHWLDQAEFVVKRLVDSGLIELADSQVAATKGSSEKKAIGKLDRYELEEILGLGGTGIVFRAKDSDLGRVVAVKVLSPDLALSGAARRRFAREGQACAAVAHESVVAIHHVHSTRNLPYLVMQYVDGASLDQIVAKAGPLDAEETLRILSQVAAGLSAAHAQGIVHRDVKPANVLIEAAGQRAWISDFGLARAVDDVGLTRTGFVAGTPHYMSPEQARGGDVSTASDLFGLGSVAYFMLTGQPPFRAEKTLAVLNRICESAHIPVKQVNPEIPPALSGLIDDLLAKRESGRPSSAAEVNRRCLELLGQIQADQGEGRALQRDQKVAPVTLERKSWSPAMVAGGLLLCVAAVLLVASQSPLRQQLGLFKNSPEPAPIPTQPPYSEVEGAMQKGVVAAEGDGREGNRNSGINPPPIGAVSTSPFGIDSGKRPPSVLMTPAPAQAGIAVNSPTQSIDTSEMARPEEALQFDVRRAQWEVDYAVAQSLLVELERESFEYEASDASAAFEEQSAFQQTLEAVEARLGQLVDSPSWGDLP